MPCLKPLAVPQVFEHIAFCGDIKKRDPAGASHEPVEFQTKQGRRTVIGMGIQKGGSHCKGVGPCQCRMDTFMCYSACPSPHLFLHGLHSKPMLHIAAPGSEIREHRNTIIGAYAKADNAKGLTQVVTTLVPFALLWVAGHFKHQSFPLAYRCGGATDQPVHLARFRAHA